jgi:carbon monoxide dehydrogenase subunit G
MKFENTFTVDAPAEEVWTALMDLERVAPAMPGAQVLERLGDDAYKVGIKVKLGPISMQYTGQVEIVERDESSFTATMRAKAKEARGQGTADAQIRIGLVEQPDGAHATIETDLQMSGRAAAMGQGVIVDVASRMVEQFAANLAGLVGQPAGLEPAPSEAPPEPEPERARAAEGEALAVSELAAGVIAGRLGNPRTLLIATAAVVLVSGAIGYAIGRSRGR